jgi:hypothetical protein
MENRLSFLVIIFAFLLKNGWENKPVWRVERAFFTFLAAVWASLHLRGSSPVTISGATGPPVLRRTCAGVRNHRPARMGAPSTAYPWHPTARPGCLANVIHLLPTIEMSYSQYYCTWPAIVSRILVFRDADSCQEGVPAS